MKKDILKHELVPEHVILSEPKEVKKVLKELNIRKDQLPKINSDDPVIKAIDAEVGDIIKITRKSDTAGKFVTYRVVQQN